MRVRRVQGESPAARTPTRKANTMKIYVAKRPHLIRHDGHPYFVRRGDTFEEGDERIQNPKAFTVHETDGRKRKKDEALA
jgi:hypothetical protein